MNIEIKLLTAVTHNELNQINALLPVLLDGAHQLTLDELKEITASDNNHVFVALADSKVVGMLTLVTYKILTGQKAWIEDVVVDAAMHGKGVGRQLVEAAVDHARALSLKSIDLTSRPSRQAANALYRKMGFESRDTNVYRMEL